MERHLRIWIFQIDSVKLVTVVCQYQIFFLLKLNFAPSLVFNFEIHLIARILHLHMVICFGLCKKEFTKFYGGIAKNAVMYSNVQNGITILFNKVFFFLSNIRKMYFICEKISKTKKKMLFLLSNILNRFSFSFVLCSFLLLLFIQYLQFIYKLTFYCITYLFIFLFSC